MDAKKLNRLKEDTAELLHLNSQQAEYLGTIIEIAYRQGRLDGAKNTKEIFEKGVS